MNDYDYTNAGYSKLLSKSEPDLEQTEDVSSRSTPQQTGTAITGGISQSPDGKLTIDWNNGEIYFFDGARKRISFGNIDALGKLGLSIRDRNGSIRMESSSGLQYFEVNGPQVNVSPNASSDDFTDIQEAVDYINNLGGGTVFLKSGTYYPDNNINLYTNVKIIGENKNTTTIDFQLAEYQIRTLGISADHITNVGLHNIEIANSGFYELGAVRFEYCDDIILNNVSIDGTDYTADPATFALYVENCQRLRIDGLSLTNNNRGIYLSGFGQTSIVDSYIYNTRGILLAVFSGSSLTFRNNVCDSNSQFSSDSIIYFNGTLTDFEISSNYFTLCKNAVINNQTGGVQRLSIRDNVMVATTGGDYGIVLNGVDNGSISGNKITGFTADGVQLNDCTNNSVIGNIIYGNGGDGIECDATTYGTTVVGNCITGNTGYGVRATGDGTNAIGNILSTNTAGASISGGSNIIDHNIT